MTIGVIGAGNIGQAIATRLAAAGIDAVISNNRGPESLAAVAEKLGPGISAGTIQQAARADIVFVSVTWEHMPRALSGLPSWGGRIVIDAMNFIIPPGLTVAELGGRASSEVVAGLVPGARLVKAFNTLTPAVLASDPRQGNGRRVIFMSGDDFEAKLKVSQLIERMGFAPIDLGGLATGGRLQQFPGGPLPSLNLIKLPMA
jgi:predicted dinucleotide-binding enzyme